MDDNRQIWREYYDKALQRAHSKRTEFAIKLNQSQSKVAVDCGCGTGSDIAYLAQQGYQVFGFDINPDSIAICQQRFNTHALVEISQSSFECYLYPSAGIIIANSSLFFAEPDQFERSWRNIESALQVGGVFAGDFMGLNDSWAGNYRSATAPLSEAKVRELFTNFDLVRFYERDEQGPTSLGRIKHWHSYSVVAIKRR